MKRKLSELEEVHFILFPREACCVVQCVDMVLKLLHQTAADYGPDGVVRLDDLHTKLVDQVEQQRENWIDGNTSAAPRE